MPIQSWYVPLWPKLVTQASHRTLTLLGILYYTAVLWLEAFLNLNPLYLNATHMYNCQCIKILQVNNYYYDMLYCNCWLVYWLSPSSNGSRSSTVTTDDVGLSWNGLSMLVMSALNLFFLKSFIQHGLSTFLHTDVECRRRRMWKAVIPKNVSTVIPTDVYET